MLSQIKNWIVRQYSKIDNFVRKHEAFLIIILLPALSILLTYIFLNIFSRIAPYNFFVLLLYYLFLLSLLYVYLLWKGCGGWLEKHQGFLVLVSILLPVILFFWQQARNESDLFFKKEVILKETNNRNNFHLQNVITDLRKNPEVIFWRNFSVSAYEEHWDYIHLNYLQECKDLYAGLTDGLNVLNDMNEKRRNLAYTRENVPIELSFKMLENASTTQKVLMDIVGKCQKVDSLK